jgi:hypothetical protein
MASTKSLTIQDIEATPQQFVDHRLQGGKVRVLHEQLITAAADAAGQIHVLGLVPSRAVPLAIYMIGAATAGMTDCDCGPHILVNAASDPVDANSTTSRDVLFDGQNLSAGIATLTNQLGLGTNARSTADWRQPLWELAGLSADPKINYAICVRVAGDVSAAVTWGFTMLYSDGA